MPVEFNITKELLDQYLTEIGKEYRKLSKNPINIIIIGGAAIFSYYSFRKYSLDVDCYIYPKSDALKQAINIVTDRHPELYNNWINEDFKNTTSYSDKIYLFSNYYRTFSNLISVRVVVGEYLAAMKLKSSRDYKRDLSDVVGIIIEEKRKGHVVKYQDIERAFKELYDVDMNEELSETGKQLLKSIYSSEDSLEKLYDNLIKDQDDNKKFRVKARELYPDAKSDNIAEIVKALKAKNSK